MDINRVVVIMGVSGAGKSTIGPLLAAELGVPYAESDTFHPTRNIAKMASGTPLDDADREPWLRAIEAWVVDRTGRGGVVSCSALKRHYRDLLSRAAPELFFLHLTADPKLIAGRLERRRDHFMPPALLASQLAALEPLADDEDGAAVAVDVPPPLVVERAVAAVRRSDAHH
jgi:gluconokinase